MPHDFLNNLGHCAQRASQRIRVKSALNPMLWLCALITPICFVAAWKFLDYQTICTTLIIVGVIPVVVTCLGFAGFAIFKPDKLQSEDYQIRHEALQIIQQKTGQMVVDPTSLHAITNPVQKQIEEGGVE